MWDPRRTSRQIFSDAVESAGAGKAVVLGRESDAAEAACGGDDGLGLGVPIAALAFEPRAAASLFERRPTPAPGVRLGHDGP